MAHAEPGHHDAPKKGNGLGFFEALKQAIDPETITENVEEKIMKPVGATGEAGHEIVKPALRTFTGDVASDEGGGGGGHGGGHGGDHGGH